MIENIKLLLGLTDTSKDELLELLKEGAVEDAAALTGNEDIEDEMPHLIMKMVIFNYNRLGTEGLDSETYSGVSYKYSNDYPEDLLKLMDMANKKRGTVYFL